MQSVVRLSDNREFKTFVKVGTDVVVQNGDDGLIHLKQNEYKFKTNLTNINYKEAMIAMLQGKTVVANGVMKYTWNDTEMKFKPSTSHTDYPVLNMTNGKIVTFQWGIEAQVG